MTTTPTKNESLPELVARWRDLADESAEKATLIGSGNAVAYSACADELEAALTREAPTEAAGDKPRHDCQDPECGCKDPAFTEPMEALAFLSGRFKYAGVSHAVAMHYARDIDAILTATPAAPQRMAQGEDVSEVTATIVRDVCETEPADPDDEDTISVSRDTLTMIVERAVKAAMNERSPSLDSERECSDHPDAPHGFDRNGSHNAGRYVCECEGWRHDDEATQPPHHDRGEVKQRARELLAAESIEPLKWGILNLSIAELRSDLADSLRAITAALTEAKQQGATQSELAAEYTRGRCDGWDAAKQQGPGEAVPTVTLKVCDGCPHLKTEWWRDYLDNDETDSGTSATCTKAGRNITAYWNNRDKPPTWCPLAEAAPQVEAKRQTGGDA